MNNATPYISPDIKAEVPPNAPKGSSKSRHSRISSLKPRILSYRSKSQKILARSKLSSNGDSQISRAQEGPSKKPSSSTSPDVFAKTAGSSIYDIFTKSQQSLSFPSESPLKRPAHSEVSSGPIEKPLRRPDDEEEIAFSDIIATLAVDVSGSTEGRVLEEEKDTISLLCKGLSRDAQKQAQIIPWSHYTDRVLRLNELRQLRSAGGTIPDSLNQGVDSRNALSKCSAWFLLTDGEIEHDDVHNFSRGICEASLHGTPCVIILFGYKPYWPAQANISVGLSVFSNASDCLFLFHDIDSTQVYILQSKGKFNELLPLRRHELILERKTPWEDLPTFHYQNLFDLHLPARQQLQPDDLLLQGGQKVNLQSLYRHRIDSSVAHDIMNNDDNLKSVLLAAQLRGKDDDIAKWVSQQKLEADNILQYERPDIDGQATRLIEELLRLIFSKDSDHVIISTLRQRLRAAHFANWGQFLASFRAHNELSAARKTVVSDAMTRIRSNRIEMKSATHSPVMLGTVSPAPRFIGFNTHESAGESSAESSGESSHEVPPYAPKLHHTQLMGRVDPVPDQNHKQRLTSGGCTNMLELLGLKDKLGRDAGVLYIKGFKESLSDIDMKRDCPFCGQDGVLMIALVKAPPEGLVTPGFPSPGQRKGLVYPLGMGSYPETDVLSSYICCDSCAFTLIRKKILVDGDEITAAIPIIPSAFSGKYKPTTFDIIDSAFQKRFLKSAVLPVFLAAIHSTIANINGDSFGPRSRSLKTMACLVANTVALPVDLGITISGPSPGTGTSEKLCALPYVIMKNLAHIYKPRSPLLQYPLEGFVVLALAAPNSHVTGLKNDLQIAIWHRFLYHLVEKHCAFINTDQAKAAIALNTILEPSETTSLNYDAVFEKDPITAAWPPGPWMGTEAHDHEVMICTTLRGTHLLSEEDLDEFERLGEAFQPVTRKSISALRPFLQYLLKQTPKTAFAIDVFDTMRASENLDDVFQIS